MRRIKYRGISTDTGKWLVGSLVPNGKTAYIAPFGELFHLEEVNPGTVGEFTGMLDKNGKEIYENDIVRYYDDVTDELVVRPVEYLNDYCAFCGVHPQKDYFRTRSRDALRKSKALEAEIDHEIERVRAMGYPAEQPPQQPSLFSPTT